nr:basic helix-loop-helix transcription factor [Loropetalum chinense var. rubrum]
MMTVDGKSNDQKANTPRSKHSATEQRRRSKINERFQILRNLIPQNDQKRDKASFLLEVIEYIQFLQEKLHAYEGSYQGWSQEPTKLTPWRNHRGPVENFVDQSQVVKNGSDHENNVVVTPAMLTNAQNSLEAEFSTAAAYKALDHPPGPAAQVVPLNVTVEPTVFSPVGRSGMPSLPRQGSVSDAENMASRPQSQLWQARPCTTECAIPSNSLNEQDELTVESGADSISSAYSRGLLNTLTQALQSSGVDLSQASISVQFDIGKRENSGLTTTSGAKDHENPSNNQAMLHSGVGSFYEDSNRAHKRVRTEKS